MRTACITLLCLLTLAVAPVAAQTADMLEQSGLMVTPEQSRILSELRFTPDQMAGLMQLVLEYSRSENPQPMEALGQALGLLDSRQQALLGQLRLTPQQTEALGRLTSEMGPGVSERFGRDYILDTMHEMQRLVPVEQERFLKLMEEFINP